ncbi:FKBP-type peptidyl-prolyl cis-trans isomerase [Thioalkalivibrio sulfidiphilus]|uniref:Peptidyl-prolyl cis-trans isomerase n=1 Tax=Thioalkalivibrio sulfidiphilus (strain HL-EbGR7) TaxID=396588 RepID=B8GL87_THISH|nr:peptidylprolyl isomerase [Thioalkalivibrio sulfidiphilus]ACL71605.1 peptidyl-prolyl cis-trans isomerase SlyD [Thioalkalivibrio sulfidiphilus HL-EbGr7]
MQISKDKVVVLDYVLTDEQGQVIDRSDDASQFAYLHGANNIIPGLEKALEGRSTGDSLKVSIPPAEAYGERDDSLTHTLDRSQFQGVDELQTGMQFHAGNPDGTGMHVVTITAIDGDAVTIDANHPLAGMTLNFDVTVREVRDASAEEIEHGHVHGPGGHHH